MPVTCLLGSQWGDEGKAKIVDNMAANMDVVVRFQGGANAGHTVVVGDKQHIFHMVPTGILRPDITCIISNGVAFDPDEFFSELEMLEGEIGNVEGRLFVSRRAHLVMEYHKRLDIAREAAAGNAKIGTTARGIGPTYADKANRSQAFRVGDLFDEPTFEKRLKEVVEQKSLILQAFGDRVPLDFDAIRDKTRQWRKKLKPYAADTVEMLGRLVEEDKNILLEGAQGAMLDIDYGTFPFVTSSNTTLGGACTGTGIPPRKIDNVVGITKAYTTRVGEGPFPTEDLGEMGKRLRDAGNEYGATTGRPRRCGWFDLVVVRHAVQISGIDRIALTKLDVLKGFKEIKVCTSYDIPGVAAKVTSMPPEFRSLEQAEPVYETFEGWVEDISGATTFEELPAAARKYVRFLEKSLGIPVAMVSVGSKRTQLVQMGVDV